MKLKRQTRPEQTITWKPQLTPKPQEQRLECASVLVKPIERLLIISSVSSKFLIAASFMRQYRLREAMDFIMQQLPSASLSIRISFGSDKRQRRVLQPAKALLTRRSGLHLSRHCPPLFPTCPFQSRSDLGCRLWGHRCASFDAVVLLNLCVFPPGRLESAKQPSPLIAALKHPERVLSRNWKTRTGQVEASQRSLRKSRNMSFRTMPKPRYKLSFK